MTILRQAERKVVDFVKADIISAFTGSTTVFTVNTGQGARFPTVPFALVLTEITRFSDPSDASEQGAAEIVVCTGRTGDDLTVVRGADGTVPFSATAGRKYRFLLDATSGYLDNVPRYLNVRTYGAKGDSITNDTQAFIDAIADLPASGGVIFVPRSSGAYIFQQNTSLIDRFKSTKSHVAILGERGSILKGANGADRTMPLIKIEGTTGAPITDILIQGLEIDGNAGAASITGSTQAHLINLKNCERVVIRDCYLHDSPGDHIRNDFDVSTVPIRDIYVLNNRFGNCYRNFVSLVLCERVVIDGNIGKGFNTFGIDAEPNGLGHLCKHIVISNNHVEPATTQLNPFNSNRAAGIQLKTVGAHDDSSHARVIGNTVVGLADAGTQYPVVGINIVDWRGASIVANQVSKCRQGISSGGDSGAVSGVYDGSTGEIVGNHVRGCVGPTSGLGIQVVAHMAIVGNTVEENDGAGIRVAGYYCSVIGNSCRSNGRNGVEGSTTVPAGIWIEGSYTIVEGNVCVDELVSAFQKYGIYLDNGTAEILVQGNRVAPFKSGGVGIRLPGSLNGSGVRYNHGFKTENGSQSAIPSGSTSITLAHGIDRTPSPQDFTITVRDIATNNPGQVWIDSIDATNFTVHCQNDPGASGFSFAWAVRARW